MKETEIKILDINISEMTQKIISLGGTKKETVLILEKSFDTKAEDLKKTGKLLRLRSVGDTVELCHKGKKQETGSFKTREETQVTVSHFETMEKILELLGYICIFHREKKRTSFTLQDVAIEIDEYPEIPPYLEIEGTEESIEKIVFLLGYEMTDTSTKSASSVIEKHGKNADFLVF